MLKNKIRLYDKTSENIIWLKVSKGVVSSTKEVYIAGVYNSPENSTYTKKDDFNALDILRQQLTKFQSSDLIFIEGNFNSEVGTVPDFITENENDLHFLPEGYELEGCIILQKITKTSL